jgi:hypothetical protein
MTMTEAVLKTVKALATDTDRVLIGELVGVLKEEGIEMEAVHSALRELQDAEKVVLYRNDQTRRITKWQHKTALMVGGCPRHLVYLT